MMTKMNLLGTGALALALTMMMSVGALAATPGPKAPAAKAGAEKKGDDDVTRTFRYELTALGQRAGEAVLRIGTEQTIGGRTLRAIQIDAETSGLAKKFVDTKTVSTTWVDQRWLPVRARWDSMWDGARRVIKAKFQGRTMNATDERDGKLHRKIDHRTAQHSADIVSIFPWLMRQEMSPGNTYAIDVFDGFRMYRLEVEVGVATDLTLPMGVRKAIPLRATVTRGEHYKREMTAYLSADEDRLPLKVVFKYGLLGQVEATLLSHRKV